MSREEILIRQEIRQILNEAGFNRETVKEIMKDEIAKMISRQTELAVKELSPTLLERHINNNIDKVLKEASKSFLNNLFWDKKVIKVELG